MSYANRKFAHCIIKWTIDMCCESPYHESFNIESSVINIPVYNTFTRWRMALRYRKYTPGIGFPIDEFFFELKRLSYEGELETTTHGEYVLTLLDYECETELGYGLYSLKTDDTHVSYIHMDRINPLPNINMELKVIIVIRLDGVTESLPECSNPYLKQLSKDLQRLYMSPCNGYEIVYQAGKSLRDFLHKGILLHRIRKEDVKQTIKQKGLINIGSPHDRDPWRKMLMFLYTADMNFSAHNPTTDVYDKAVAYGVEPLITYYEPDNLELHNQIEYEELEFTWTVTDFLCREEKLLFSRGFAGEVSNTIMKLGKTSPDDFVVNFYMSLETERHLCIEVFFRTESSEIVISKNSVSPSGACSVISITDKRKFSEFEDILKGGWVNLTLLVRMSCVEREDDRERLRPIGLTKIIRKPFCNEQNYIQLSDDLMSFYRSSKYFNVNINSPVATYTNEDKDYLLRFRNKQMAEVLFSEHGRYRGDFEPSVLRAVLQFMYCAKLGDIVDIEDSFKLIDIATECSFDSLRDALIDNLKKLLTEDNVNEIHSFAKSRNLLEFVSYMTSQENLPTKCRRLGKDLSE